MPRPLSSNNDDGRTRRLAPQVHHEVYPGLRVRFGDDVRETDAKDGIGLRKVVRPVRELANERGERRRSAAAKPGPASTEREGWHRRCTTSCGWACGEAWLRRARIRCRRRHRFGQSPCSLRNRSTSATRSPSWRTSGSASAKGCVIPADPTGHAPRRRARRHVVPPQPRGERPSGGSPSGGSSSPFMRSV